MAKAVLSKLLGARFRFIAVSLLILLVAIISGLFFSAQFLGFNDQQAVYVSAESGSDTNPGTEQLPFATLQKARDAVRGTTISRVYVRKGNYNLTSPLTLDASDSGGTNEPRMWLNYPGERPIITGSLPVANWTLENGTTYVTSLAGTAAENANFDFVYINDTQLTPARYPNWGGALDATLTDPYQGRFSYVAQDQAAVQNVVKYRVEDAATISQLAGESGLTMYINDRDGLWRWLETRTITSINTATREITLSSPLPHNVAVGELYWIQGSKKLLSANEFHYDTVSKQLRINIPTKLQPSDVVYVPVTNDLILNGASDITWQGFKIEKYNNRAFHVISTVSHVTFRGNEVRFGKNAFTTEYRASTYLAVEDNHLFDLDSGAIAIYGGNFMKSLTPTHNSITNNVIENIDLYAGRTGSAVWLDKEQVGILVQGNTIRNTSRHGIIVSGNDHQILNNDISGNGWLRQDTGGINFGGRDILQTGHVVKGNYIHDPRAYIERSYGNWESLNKNSTVAAFVPFFDVMVDDWTSGITIEQNILENPAGTGISNHGGMSNVIKNNYCVNCREAIIFDEPITATGFFAPLYTDMYQKLQNMSSLGYNSSLYLQRYPHISALKAAPKEGETLINNTIVGNIFASSTNIHGTTRPYKFHRGGRQDFHGNVIKYHAGQPFNVTYEAPDDSSSVVQDLSLAQWKALGNDLDMTEIAVDGALFDANYQYSTSAPAAVRALPQLDPLAAGAKTVSAPEPTVTTPTTVTSSVLPVSIQSNAPLNSYNITAVEYQLRLKQGTSLVPVTDWETLPQLGYLIDKYALTNGNYYSVCVRQKNDALNVSNLSADALWSAVACSNQTLISIPIAAPAPIAVPPAEPTLVYTPPSLSVTAPRNGARVYSRVAVNAVVSDPDGVNRVELYVDGAQKATLSKTNRTSIRYVRINRRWRIVRTPYYSFSYNFRSISRGTHQVEVKAFDNLGSVASRVISVRK